MPRPQLGVLNGLQGPGAPGEGPDARSHAKARQGVAVTLSRAGPGAPPPHSPLEPAEHVPGWGDPGGGSKPQRKGSGEPRAQTEGLPGDREDLEWLPCLGTPGQLGGHGELRT